MFPSETSLLPVSVALAEFVEKHGLIAFSMWYDSWYLGVPFRFIAEPAVPILMVMTQKLMPSVALLDISIYFAVVSLFIGSVGWSLLFSRLSKTQKKRSFIVLVLMLLIPWRVIDVLAISALPLSVARGLLPFVLITYWNVLTIFLSKSQVFQYGLLAVMGTVCLLFISMSIFPILIVGSISILVAKGYRKGKVRLSAVYGKRLFAILTFSLALVMLWFTPRYFQTLIFNPSLGGLTPVAVLSRLYGVLRGIAPVGAAIFVVGLGKKSLSRLQVFTGVWGGTFLLISGFRFISDIDFWMDWSSWMTELTIGIVLFAGSLGLSRGFSKYSVSLVLVLLFISYSIFTSLGRPNLITRNLPDPVSRSFDIIRPHRGERMFLSGSDTFWSGLLPESVQIRGGRDSLATNAYWDHASYQLREGTDPELVRLWSEALGIKYILVHTERSDNFYHDFKTFGKWQEFKVIDDDTKGNLLIDTKVKSLAWEVSEGVLDSIQPERGDDTEALVTYLSYRLRPIQVTKTDFGYHILSDRSHLVQISMTYDAKWRAFDEEGNEKTLVADPVGNSVVYSEGAQEIILTFN